MRIEKNNVEFPIEALPEPIRAIACAAESALGYPREFICSSMLVSFATAMGNRWSLEVKQGWTERALLYMAIVGNAGSNKTHPMKFALAPLIDIDLAKIAAAEALEPYVAPPRFVASDVTQESLVKLHQSNSRGLCLFVDELKAWVANFNRYNGASQEQFWLSNFSRTPIIVDRKSDLKPISIAEPMISVIGSTQPSVLRTFAQGDKSTNGFVDRLLFSIRKESGKAYWSDVVIEPQIVNEWSALVRCIAENETPILSQFSPYAKAVAAAWQAKNTDLINSCDNDRLVGGYSKLEIYFVRLCLILHAMRYACYIKTEKSLISAETVQDAVLLIEYFRAQLEAAQSLLYPDVEAGLTKRFRDYLSALPESFSRREAIAIGLELGLSRATAYRAIKEFTGTHIKPTENKSYCRVLEDL